MWNNDFLIGMSSSIISYGITYPIDAIKTNFQLSSYKNNSATVNNTIRQIYKSDGIRGFYKGISSTFITYPIFWGTFFGTLSYSNVFVASTFASLITNPLFVLKTRFQSDLVNKPNYLNLIKQIYEKENIYGFFKGFGSTVINNTKLCIQFPLYDYLKIHTNSILFASMLSKIAASTIYYPTDLIRTNQRNSQVKISFLEATKNIYKINGFIGFYKGVLIYNAVSIPNFIIMMFIKEYIQKIE